MAINRTINDRKPHSLTHIWNMGFDQTYQLPVVEMVGFDGNSLLRTSGGIPMNIKITESGSYTYIAKAPVGTTQATAGWQVMRLDESSGLLILYADGDANFDNVATDLTALSYS